MTKSVTINKEIFTTENLAFYKRDFFGHKKHQRKGGHNYSRIFRPIKQLPEGALVQILDAGGKVTDYEVVSLEILNPDQVEALTADAEDWDLSLFTCTTGGGRRYVVRCARVDQ